MRIGYSYWGFLGDYKEDSKGKELSTPDGNAAYGGFLIDAMQARGHKVYMMQVDRDWAAFTRRGWYDFSAFSQDRRFYAYLKCKRTMPGDEAFAVGPDMPPLDLLFLEWRFPIPGRNTSDMKGKPGYQPDLERQTELLEHYAGLGTKIVIWDLDHKVTPDDEVLLEMYGVAAIVETSVCPRKGRIPRYRVEPPVAVADLRQLIQKAPNPSRKLVYVGSRYERDDVIEEWVRPVSDRYPGQVEFFGNWTAEYNFAEVQAKWPNVSYKSRISMKDFYAAYADAVACPLLAKRGYLETGFITPRIWEALLFGTIPVGLAPHHGIEQYLPVELIARNAAHLGDITEYLAHMKVEDRTELRDQIVEKIKFMDASNFVAVLEGVVK